MGSRTSLAPLMSSARQDWQTPEEVLELVRQVAPIGLDPCTTPDNPTRADRWIAPPADGLAVEWSDFCGPSSLAFCNPEYGRSIPKWMHKCASEGLGLSVEIIALVPARPDTRWWHNWATTAFSVCFWRGRMTFRRALHPAPFPSALLYWGTNERKFRDVFEPYGWVVTQ